MSALEENKNIVRCFNKENWNQKKFEIIDETYAPAWGHHDSSNPVGLGDGPESNRARLLEVSAPSPDIHPTLEKLVAEDNKVIACFTLIGTDLGRYLGRPSSGNTVTHDGIDIFCFTDEKSWNARVLWTRSACCTRLGQRSTKE